MMKKVYYITLICSLLTMSQVFAQSSDLNQVGTSMANFLKVGVGARATAMGDAYVALSNDITSLFWNPGGLATLENNESVFQVTNWLMGSKLYFFGTSINLHSIGTLGLSFNSFSSGEMEETTIWEPEGTGRKFSAGNFALGLTYSRRITERFSAGLSVKYISETLDRVSAGTVAIDIGSIFVTNFLNDLRIGFALSNLGGQMQLNGSDLNIQYQVEPGTKYTRANLATEPWDIPLLFRFGLATDIIRNENYRFTASAELVDSRDFIHLITFGTEVGIREMFFMRGGYKLNTDVNDFSLGGGLYLPSFKGIGLKLDYAYTNFDFLDSVQRFSIILSY